MDYDDDEDDVPTVQSNGNEEGSVIVAAVSNDSVWLDREEDEMIQNVKRRKYFPVTESSENESEVLKRRKTATGVPCSNEDRPPSSSNEKLSEGAMNEEKAESCKSSPPRGVKLCKSVEEVDYLDHTGADHLNEADTLGHVTNGPGYIKTHEVTGS